MPTLFVLSGLPATGKTTLSRQLARHVQGVHLRIDTIEQALRDLCGVTVQGEGYRLAERVAADNLQNGIDVIADSCNPIELTRAEWRQVAADNDSACIEIELICSDREEHRRRVETRAPDIAGLVLSSWEQVCNREYHSWTTDRIVVDTGVHGEAAAWQVLVESLPDGGWATRR